MLVKLFIYLIYFDRLPHLLMRSFRTLVSNTYYF